MSGSDFDIRRGAARKYPWCPYFCLVCFVVVEFSAISCRKVVCIFFGLFDFVCVWSHCSSVSVGVLELVLLGVSECYFSTCRCSIYCVVRLFTPCEFALFVSLVVALLAPLGVPHVRLSEVALRVFLGCRWWPSVYRWLVWWLILSHRLASIGDSH